MPVYFNKTKLLRTVVKFEDLRINGGSVIESVGFPYETSFYVYFIWGVFERSFTQYMSQSE